MALTALEPGVWVGGWTWPLPSGATSARQARALVRDTLTSLALPSETVLDAELMVSELATNAHQHASAYQPHELWLGPAEEQQVFCAIFDGLRMNTLTGRATVENCDFGRGLGIVAELSQGRWGMYHTCSRQGPSVQGKAVWFAVR
jgi:hypothetical protein